MKKEYLIDEVIKTNDPLQIAILTASLKLISSLSPKEEYTLRRRFGLNCERETLQSIGNKLKLTRQRIREIEAKGLRRLKHPVRIKSFLNILLKEYEKEREIAKEKAIKK